MAEAPHQNIFKQNWTKISNFFSPDTIDETATKRLVSIDFLRGIAIFIMLLGHEFETVMGPIGTNVADIVFYYIIGAPCGITAGYRTFFIMISGISHAYVFGSSCLAKRPGQVLLALFMQFLGALAAIPLFYVFHVCNVFCYNFQNGNFVVEHPWWKNLSVYSHPPIYFGLSQPINSVVIMLIFASQIVPLSCAKKLKKWHIMWISAAVCMVVSIILPFIFMSVSQSLRGLYEKNYDIKINGDDSNTWRECPGNFFGPTADNIHAHFRSVALHFVSGNYM